MTERMTHRKAFDIAHHESSMEFRSRNPELKSNEADMIDNMAITTAVIHSMLRILSKAPNQNRMGFSRKLFRLKEEVDRSFPIICDEGGDITDMCPLCCASEEGECDHGNHIRAALILMALLRIHPPCDLDDSEEEEAPDPNQGMVPTEE